MSRRGGSNPSTSAIYKSNLDWRYSLCDINCFDKELIHNEQQTQWSCEEVIVWAPLSANKITEKVLTEKWDNNYEQKLVNEYNAAVMGMLSEDVAQKRKDAYMTFLQERTELKTIVDNDCKEIGIK